MDRDIYSKIIAKIKSLGTKLNGFVDNIPSGSFPAALNFKTYEASDAETFIAAFVPEAHAYLEENNLPGAVFAGTVTSTSMYSAVISLYNTGGFSSGYVVFGTTMYLVQYNKGTTTVTMKTVTAT